MRSALLIGWLWLLPLGAALARLPTPPPTDTLRLLARNDGPWLPYFTYCFDPGAQSLGGGPLPAAAAGPGVSGGLHPRPAVAARHGREHAAPAHALRVEPLLVCG